MTTLDAAGRIVPVLLLFVTGLVLKQTRFLAASTMTDIKKLVVNIALPALMFTAFLSLEPGLSELILAGSIFAVSLLFLVGSRLIDRATGGRWGIRSYMMGGYEAGMLGYALFLSVFGQDALPVFASVDLGQVVFVFVILMPILQARHAGEAKDPSDAGRRHATVQILRRVATSPIVWAIAGGMIVGAIGRAASISAEPFAPIAGYLDLIGGLTAPLIALVIGYELEFRGDVLGRALVFVLIRKIVLVGTALLGLWLIPGIPALTRFAILTMLLLPPPYVVTLAAHDDEQGLTASILSTSTVISVVAFAVAVFATGGVL
jgi:predicted permease